jgi:hypothetical protein
MSTFPFPDEAVEAAAAELFHWQYGATANWGAQIYVEKRVWLDKARVALAAVVPFLGTPGEGERAAVLAWIAENELHDDLPDSLDIGYTQCMNELRRWAGGDAAPQQASTARELEAAPALDRGAR